MEEKKDLTKDQLRTQISLFEDLIKERGAQFETLMEGLKRLEGHSNGSKDLAEKIGSYIKKQQAELSNLQLPAELIKFFQGTLENTRTLVRGACGDVERLYFSKQGELLFIQQEVEGFLSKKKDLEKSLEALENLESEKEISNEQKEKPLKKEKIRPDQDTTTKIGRAAIDIKERKRKYQKKSL